MILSEMHFLRQKVVAAKAPTILTPSRSASVNLCRMCGHQVRNLKSPFICVVCEASMEREATRMGFPKCLKCHAVTASASLTPTGICKHCVQDSKDSQAELDMAEWEGIV